VVHPARGLSTRAVFSTLDLTTQKPEETIAGFAEWLGTFFAPDGRQESKQAREQGQQSGLCPVWGRNDLQPGAEALEPTVAQALQILRTALMEPLAAHSPTLRFELRFDARMTGSGSAVFAVIGASDCSGLLGRRGLSDERLDGLQGLLPDLLPEGWQGRLCEGLREHPLRDWIDA
jgi:4-diphosphocytidyl-2-C-methyl-D-erythritol kinase